MSLLCPQQGFNLGHGWAELMGCSAGYHQHHALPLTRGKPCSCFPSLLAPMLFCLLAEHEEHHGALINTLGLEPRASGAGRLLGGNSGNPGITTQKGQGAVDGDPCHRTQNNTQTAPWKRLNSHRGGTSGLSGTS